VKSVNRLFMSPHFKDLLKKKKKNQKYLLDRIESALNDLRESPMPESLGPLKSGPLKGTRAYKLNDSSRILYSVERRNGECIVNLLRICDHKNVYGRD